MMPIFRRRALQRLEADIHAYEVCVQGRAKTDKEYPATRLPAIQCALNKATEALKNGKMDSAWKEFQTAHRLELFALGEVELKATASAIREEAIIKLNAWRKNAVLALLNDKSNENVQGREDESPDAKRKADHDLLVRVFRAATLRDEHYGNEAYRQGLRRSNTLFLAIALIIAIALVLLLAYKEYLLDVGVGPGTFSDLLGMAAVGFLGATFSAITAPRSQDPTRIPELVWSIHIALLRLLMGPASAIVIYFAMQSSLYDQFLRVKPDSSGFLAIAFVAGFTERLVLRFVEAFAKSTS